MQSQIKTRILVTSAGAPPGTNMIRALKKIPGVEIIGADADPCAAALYLYPDRAVSLPLVSDEGNMWKRLRRLFAKSPLPFWSPALSRKCWRWRGTGRHCFPPARGFWFRRRRLWKKPFWVGPAGIEFKTHVETKKPMLLEIKPRMWGYSRLAAECGVNFPQVMAGYLLGRPVKERHEYSLGRVFMRGYRDVVMGNFRIAGAPK